MPRKAIPRPSPSPWQALVLERAELTGHTTRSLAAAITTPRRAFANTTLWSWTRCHDGGPSPSAYKPEVNRLMAKALGIPPDTLAAAYDQSRLCFTTGNGDASARRMAVLRKMFADSSRETWTRDDIVATIDEILTM
jgi:hypothetical protein